MSGESSSNPVETSALPNAQFIEDVAKFLGDRSADEVIHELNENFRQYKLEESRLLQRRAYNLSKLPEIKKTLGIVNLLIDKENEEGQATVDFELSDSVFARASFESIHNVNLWLGAGVMVEYPLCEAQEVLEQSLSNCLTNLDTTKAELEQIKDSITITEVSIARIYNYDIEKRRQAKTG